jgi:hypothetical protein
LTSRPTTPTPCPSSSAGTRHDEHCDPRRLELRSAGHKHGGRRSAHADEPIPASGKTKHVGSDLDHS